MRRPRDFDAELNALNGKAKQLRARKLHQLGELVIATSADALPAEQLAGLLLMAVESKDTAEKEGWRKRGAAFFQGTAKSPARGDRGEPHRDQASHGSASSAASEDRAP
jgi:DNA-binding protein H-NS